MRIKDMGKNKFKKEENVVEATIEEVVENNETVEEVVVKEEVKNITPSKEEQTILSEAEEKVAKFSAAVNKIKDEIKKDVVGQEDIVNNVIIAIIAGGNVLLEGVPGVGKTRLVRSLSQVLHLPFSRIQFTPDLMPSDVTGTNVIDRDAEVDKYFASARDLMINLIVEHDHNAATIVDIIMIAKYLERIGDHATNIANWAIFHLM